MRAASADHIVQVTPAIDTNLERALEYIDRDEFVEVTPTKVRIRKQYTQRTRPQETRRRGLAEHHYEEQQNEQVPDSRVRDLF